MVSGLIFSYLLQPNSCEAHQGKFLTAVRARLTRNVSLKGEKNHDLSPGFAGALFAAAKYSSLDVNVELLKNCFAVAILLMAVSKTLLESDPFGGVRIFSFL